MLYTINQVFIYSIIVKHILCIKSDLYNAKHYKTYEVTLTSVDWYGRAYLPNYTTPSDFSRAIGCAFKTASDNGNYQLFPNVNNIFIYKIDGNRALTRCTQQDTINLTVIVYYI